MPERISPYGSTSPCRMVEEDSPGSCVFMAGDGIFSSGCEFHTESKEKDESGSDPDGHNGRPELPHMKCSPPLGMPARCPVGAVFKLLGALLMLAGLAGPESAGAQPRACTQGDVNCQVPRPGDKPVEQRAARDAALVDLTGQWVSVVTEDWRHYMMTPPKGDYESVPLNGHGIEVANSWDPGSATNADPCLAYGGAALMRMPGRFRISWQGDSILKVESDSGRQTRLLRFDGARNAGESRSRQGQSIARWVEEGRARGTKRFGTLEVVTEKLLPGFLRGNGVPVSENAVVTEYFDRFETRKGDSWLVVTTIVEDPTYLAEPFVTTSHLKREQDTSGWSPEACFSGGSGSARE